jgi:hypothetical protein
VFPPLVPAEVADVRTSRHGRPESFSHGKAISGKQLLKVHPELLVETCDMKNPARDRDKDGIACEKK